MMTRNKLIMKKKNAQALSSKVFFFKVLIPVLTIFIIRLAIV